MTEKRNMEVADKCSLAQAIVWKLSGRLPIKSELVKNQSMLEFGLSNKKAKFKASEIEAAKAEIIDALLNGKISSSGVHAWFKEDEKIEVPKIFADNTIIWNDYIDDKVSYLPDSGIEQSIPRELWAQELADINKNTLSNPGTISKYFHFRDVKVSTKELIETLGDNESLAIYQARRGRVPNVSKEVWQEELLLLILSGDLPPNATKDTIDRTLCDTINDKNVGPISLETVRKNWTRPLFNKLRERNKNK
ncbi:MAG: hypothetical protein H6912_03260 [Kordiimonadaceae bacterium]|nr:hypothetical protein [Kordiimonadaceae bacterium]